MDAGLPVPVLIGFFPKKTAPGEAWFGNDAVREICSVSKCISPGPANWETKWVHNDWWVFDSEELALKVIDDDPGQYDLYAYKLFPVVFDGAIRTEIAVTSTAAGSLSAYRMLGYDVVSLLGYDVTNRSCGSCGPLFECSSFSCNRGCAQYDVNPHCLIDRADDALRICQEIARDAAEKGSWEPGPYCVVEVWRKRSNDQIGAARPPSTKT